MDLRTILIDGGVQDETQDLSLSHHCCIVGVFDS
jgi:hypothetical protein